MEQRASRGEALFHPNDNDVPLHGPSAQQGGGPQGPRQGRGVTRHKGKYRARLWRPGEKCYLQLGLHETEEEAIAAVEAARKRLAEGREGK